MDKNECRKLVVKTFDWLSVKFGKTLAAADIFGHVLPNFTMAYYSPYIILLPSFWFKKIFYRIRKVIGKKSGATIENN